MILSVESNRKSCYGSGMPNIGKMKVIEWRSDGVLNGDAKNDRLALV
jgi:hypothetical protein